MTAQEFARFCAYMEYDRDESIDALMRVFEELPEAEAEKVVGDAYRERQELDISDTHTELLDAQAIEGEQHG